MLVFGDKHFYNFSTLISNLKKHLSITLIMEERNLFNLQKQENKQGSEPCIISTTTSERERSHGDWRLS